MPTRAELLHDTRFQRVTAAILAGAVGRSAVDLYADLEALRGLRVRLDFEIGSRVRLRVRVGQSWPAPSGAPRGAARPQGMCIDLSQRIQPVQTTKPIFIHNTTASTSHTVDEVSRSKGSLRYCIGPCLLACTFVAAPTRLNDRDSS